MTEKLEHEKQWEIHVAIQRETDRIDRNRRFVSQFQNPVICLVCEAIFSGTKNQEPWGPNIVRCPNCDTGYRCKDALYHLWVDSYGQRRYRGRIRASKPDQHGVVTVEHWSPTEDEIRIIETSPIMI